MRNSLPPTDQTFEELRAIKSGIIESLSIYIRTYEAVLKLLGECHNETPFACYYTVAGERRIIMTNAEYELRKKAVWAILDRHIPIMGSAHREGDFNIASRIIVFQMIAQLYYSSTKDDNLKSILYNPAP